MGFLISLLLSLAFVVLGVLRPRLAAYLILALFVLFEELGPDFTTYRGSFVFNANFVGLAGLRLFEMITLAAYIPIFLLSKDRGLAMKGFGPERAMTWTFVVMILAFTALELAVQGTFTYSNWRVILTGLLQFHMLILLFRTEDDLKQLLKVFLILLVVKSIWGLAMWAAGMGLVTPRGRLPFFWDSRQVEAFGLGAVILTAYLLNYTSIEQKHRLFSFFWASIMWIVLVTAVMGSIRRTIWVTTLLGMFGVLVLSRRTNVLHYLAVIAVASVTVAALLFTPGLERFRAHMGQYVASLNLFDVDQRAGNVENDVHVNNVEQYAKMLTENPDILAFGTYGPSGLTFDKILRGRYSGEYRLGMAHNGILRSLLFFGVLGLILYLWFHFVALRRAWKIYWAAPETHFLKHAALGCATVLLLDFSASLFFVPPFYTSTKGLYYTFFEVFVIGLVACSLAAAGVRTRSSRLRSAKLDSKRAAV